MFNSRTQSNGFKLESHPVQVMHKIRVNFVSEQDVVKRAIAVSSVNVFLSFHLVFSFKSLHLCNYPSHSLKLDVAK